ncbi:MAG: hypothetical protein M1829_004255 [Trizodia sp. TS-e1964]|nr:MAG: hypothetical protein M1829_004255 [Trizodia sp. TS-e1964]
MPTFSYITSFSQPSASSLFSFSSIYNNHTTSNPWIPSNMASNPEKKRPHYKDVVTSKLFKFIIGPDREEIPLYSASVMDCSPALRALMTGPMIEAQKGEVVIDDVDVETFVRFSEWVNRGRYTPAAKTRRDGSVKTDSDDSDSHRRKRRKTGERADFKVGSCKNLDRTISHAEYFMSHAKLHTFADKYGVLELVVETTAAMREGLTHFFPFLERVTDITDLIVYVWQNTPDLTPVKSGGLRALLLAFVVAHRRMLFDQEGFLLVVEGGGAFARELMLGVHAKWR